MKIKEWYNNKLKSFENDFDFRLEKLILSITESISKKMEIKDINRRKLSELLDVSPPAVTKILNGTSNFTLKTLLSLADALDLKLKVDFEDIEYTDTLSTYTIDSKNKSMDICVAYHDEEESKKRFNFIVPTTAEDIVPHTSMGEMHLRNAA